MFIPPGETIHESLATSYVLVDALVLDLCEGGFSGVIEVVLRDIDSFIIVSNGIVSAAVALHNGVSSTNGKVRDYTRTTVSDLAERSRLERGRVSIYGYPVSTAGAVAGRINAQPLYVGLSPDFTDLEKMISKLLREEDREWFIEVSTEGTPSALIHMRDGSCRVFTSKGRTDSGALDLSSNPALRRLIDECNEVGGTFDVYFTQVTAEPFDPVGRATPERIQETPLTPEPPVDEPDEKQTTTLDQPFDEFAGHEPLFEQDPASVYSAIEESSEPDFEYSDHVAASAGAPVGLSDAPDLPSAVDETEQDDGALVSHNEDLLFGRDELSADVADAEAMADVKRLMSEIARTIEEAAQSVGRSESFSMSLRAGQLEIANRYPFLDPFAGEFEYLAGEVVFVGNATVEEFVEGLTEALKLSIEGVTRSTPYADRFRSYVAEDLHKLQARERAEFEKFALEEIIPRLINS